MEQKCKGNENKIAGRDDVYGANLNKGNLYVCARTHTEM